MVTQYGDIKKRIEQQIELEAEMRQRGGKRFKDRETKAITKERESMSTHGKKMLKAGIDRFEEGIVNFLNDINR